MKTITEFLRERLDEDETTARNAIAIREEVYAHNPSANQPDYAFMAWDDHPAGIVLVGPERVLREVEAKREILKAAGPHPLHSDLAYAVEQLAIVYADHEDFQSEWR